MTTENQTIPFDIKTEKHVLTALSKLLNEKGKTGEKGEADLIDCVVMDDSNCLCVMGKTPDARRVLSRFTNNYNVQKVPALDYGKRDLSDHTGKYAAEWLLPALKLMDATFKTVTLKVSYDYPITIENPYFMVIIAPRVTQ